jgi:chromosomal replication initiation ATPase DnaA
VRAVLVKHFTDRQLTVEATVIDFLALHIERSLDAARAVVGALDREALALGRRVTRAMAGDIIRRMADVS